MSYNEPYAYNGVQGLMQALLSDRKIDAIKLVRELTGLGLKEAKDVVEGTVEAIAARAVNDYVAGSKHVDSYDRHTYGTFVVVTEDSVCLQSYLADAEQEAKDRILLDQPLLICKVVAKARTEVKIDKV